MSRPHTIRELAAHVGGHVVGDPERLISGVSSPAAASPHDLVFVDSAKQVGELSGSAAGAALVPSGVEAPVHMAAIRVEHPALAMIQLVELLVPARRTFDEVSPLAFLGRGAEIGPKVGIGPFVYIGE